MREYEVGVLPTTVWEISAKALRGRLPNFWGPNATLADFLAGQKLQFVGLTWEDAEASAELPAHHRDPMDRLLIAAALRKNATVITSDSVFSAYNVKTVW